MAAGFRSALSHLIARLSSPGVTTVIAAYGTVESPAQTGTVEQPINTSTVLGVQSPSWEYLLFEDGTIIQLETGEYLEAESSTSDRAGLVRSPEQVGTVSQPPATGTIITKE